MKLQNQLACCINTKKYYLKSATFTSIWFAIRQQFSRCDLCSNAVDNHLLLCNHCLHDLPLFRYNLIAGDLLNWPAINKLLPKISFDHLFCLAPYQAPFNLWIMHFKYQGRFELAQLLSDLLAQHFVENNNIYHSFDLVLSVPLHISKWQSRGYNQAHLLADPLAKKLQCDYWPWFLQRIVNNISQVGHDGQQRRKNLRNAFKIKGGLPKRMKHILLVDDVVTTGSTASEIAKLLKKHGAEEITVLALCLSLPQK
jgi:ComF family protein